MNTDLTCPRCGAAGICPCPPPPVSEWTVGEMQGGSGLLDALFRPSQGREMISGWRRFFTWDYWRWQWLFLWNTGRPVNILAVGTLHVPEGEERR